MNPTRFTLDGSDGLERRLAEACHTISREIRSFVPRHLLEALVLGGGYGRGEGGVLTRDGRDAPYNDLEFFVFLQGPVRWNERRYDKAFRRLERDMTADLGIDVEFKIISKLQFDRQATTMFYYDLVRGHHVIWGPQAFLENHAHGLVEQLPDHEATRLLFNRFSGLLFSRQRLSKRRFDAQDADFVLRNINKTKLAMGDAVLALEGRYHWSCRERSRQLSELCLQNLPMSTLRRFHDEGCAFKLHPCGTKAGREELMRTLSEVLPIAWSVWQWAEERRLSVALPSPSEYAMMPGTLCPDTHPAKNVLIRLRQFGPQGILRHAFRYPREALFRSMSLLLWAPARFDRHRLFLSRQLRSSFAQWQEAVTVYGRLWHRFN